VRSRGTHNADKSLATPEVHHERRSPTRQGEALTCA
jgi:hypothetical protein